MIFVFYGTLARYKLFKLTLCRNRKAQGFQPGFFPGFQDQILFRQGQKSGKKGTEFLVGPAALGGGGYPYLEPALTGFPKAGFRGPRNRPDVEEQRVFGNTDTAFRLSRL